MRVPDETKRVWNREEQYRVKFNTLQSKRGEREESIRKLMER